MIGWEFLGKDFLGKDFFGSYTEIRQRDTFQNWLCGDMIVNRGSTSSAILGK